MRWLPKTRLRSFYLLNATQFLGALNDNIFKLLVIYLLIHVKGPAAANAVLSLAGAIFVIPFLIFASTAGVMADRFSKRTIIVYTKATEVVVMVFGLISVYFEWEVGSYIALFLMAAQSAFFGPSKYGIIPELVDSDRVSRANGSITSFTYIAVIGGTFLASFITDITNKNFILVSLFCVFIALIGVLTSLGISRTAPQNSPKKINPIFLYEIYKTLKFSWTLPHLLPAIYGSSYFLFLGAFTQLNIIPFAIQSLGLSEVGGGYLFLPTAVGIATGGLLVGRISKGRIEPGLSCIAGFFIALFFICLSLCSSSLPLTIFWLTLIGVGAGIYLIPFDAFLQVNSPQEKRGQMIAAASFLGFVGVLMAALFLFLISEEMGFTASAGFAVMGLLTFITNFVMMGRISALFFPFFARKILKRVRKLHLISPIPDPSAVIILQSRSWWDAILLFAAIPKLRIFVPGPSFRHFPWFNGLFESIRIIAADPHPRTTEEQIFGFIRREQDENCTACLFLHGKKDYAETLEAYSRIFQRLQKPIIFAHTIKERRPKRFLGIRYYEKQIVLSFQVV